jgi:hypothetical protein
MARILVPRITPERPVRRCHLRISLSLIFLFARDRSPLIGPAEVRLRGSNC